MPIIGEAFIEILPVASDFAPKVQEQVEKAVSGATPAADELGKAFDGAARRIETSLDDAAGAADRSMGKIREVGGRAADDVKGSFDRMGGTVDDAARGAADTMAAVFDRAAATSAAAIDTFKKDFLIQMEEVDKASRKSGRAMDKAAGGADASKGFEKMSNSAGGLTGKLAGMTSGIPLVGSSLDNMSKKMTEAHSSGGKLTSVLGDIGKTSVLGGAAVAAGVAAESIKMATGFQSSMTLLVTGAGEAKSNMAKVQSGILALAPATATSTASLASGMFMIESAGFHGAAGLNVLKAAAEGAKAGNADLKTVADGLTTAMTDYHEPASKAASVTSQLMETVASGKTTMADLAGSLSHVLPTASAAHIGLSQVLGAMATMTGEGISARRASMNLNAAIGSLSKPTAASTKAMAAMGLDSTTVAAQLGHKGLTGTMSELYGAIMKHMGPAGLVLQDTMNQSTHAAQDAALKLGKLPQSLQATAKAYQAGKLTAKDWTAALKEQPATVAHLAAGFASSVNAAGDFNAALKGNSSAAQTFNATLAGMVGGQSGMTVALATTGTHMDTFTGNVKNIDHASKAGAKTVQGFAETTHDFGFKMESAKQTVEALGIKLGLVLIPYVEKAAKALQTGVEWLMKHKTAAEVLAGVIAGALAIAIGTFIVLTGIKMVKAVGHAGQAIGGLGKKLLGMGGTAEKSAGTVAEATAATSGAFDALVASVTAATTEIKSALGLMATSAEGDAVAMEGAVESIGVATEGMAATVEAAAPEAGFAMDSLLGPLGMLIPVIMLVAEHWKKIWGIIKEVAKAVFDFLKPAVKTFVEFFKSVWKDIEKPVVRVFDAIKNVISGVVSWITSHWMDLVEGIIAVFLPGGLIIAAFIHWHTAIIKVVTEVVEDVVRFFEELPSKIITAITSLAGRIGSFFTGTILPVFVTVLDSIVGYFTALPGRFIQGLANLYSLLSSFFTGTILPVFTGFLDSVITWVTGIPQRFITGITNLYNLLGSFLTGTILPVFTGFFDTVITWVAGIPQRFITNITALYDLLTAFLTGTIIPVVTGFLDSVITYVMTLPSRFITGITNLYDLLTGFLTNTILPVVTGFLDSAVAWFAGLPGRAVSALLGFGADVESFLTVHVLDKFQNLYNSVLSLFAGLPGDVVKAVDGLGTAIQNFFNSSVLPVIKVPINAVIGGLNFVIGGVDDIAGLVGLKGPAKIPTFAQGGNPHEGFRTNGPAFIVGEGNQSHPEWVIATDPAFRDRNLSLWREAGKQLGIDAFASGGTTGRSVGLGGGAPTVAGTGTSSDPFTAIGHAISDVASSIASGAADVILGPLFSTFEGMIGDQFPILTAVAKSLENDVKEWVHGSSVTGKLTPTYSTSGGVAQWGPTVAQAAALLHLPASVVPGVLQIIARESSGNPNPPPPHDINWPAHPSMGLMQVIGPTFRAYAGQFANTGPFEYGTSVNPLANIYAGMNYALHNYGEPWMAAGGNHTTVGKTGYYQGGVPALNIGGHQIDTSSIAFKKYDRGGVLDPGLTMSWNDTGFPEFIPDPTSYRGGPVVLAAPEASSSSSSSMVVEPGAVTFVIEGGPGGVTAVMMAEMETVATRVLTETLTRVAEVRRGAGRGLR